MKIGIAASLNSSELKFASETGNAVEILLLNATESSQFNSQLAHVTAVYFHDSCSCFDQRVTDALRKRKHVLIECASMTDPFTMRRLSRLAEEAGVVFQVRNQYLESGLWKSAAENLDSPGFVECRRTNLSPVVMNQSALLRELVPDLLMLFSAIRSNVRRIAASQVTHPNGQSAVLNVRIDFDNGSTGSLIHSSIPVRRSTNVSIVQREAFIDIDFDSGEASIARTAKSGLPVSSVLCDTKDNSFFLNHFVSAIESQQNTGPDAFDATMALSVGYDIIDKLRIPIYRNGLAS